MVRLSENPEYGFAVGRVRALETALLDRARYDRLIRTPGVREFVAALAETVYSKFLEGGLADVPRALDHAARENAAFFFEYARDPWLFDLFRLPVAFHKLKTAIKRSLAEKKSEVVIPEEFVNPAFASRVSDASAAAVADYDRDRDPAAVDIAMDRLMQELQLQTAVTSEFMVGYLGLHADLENLRMLVRVKAQSGDRGDRRGDLAAALLPGGTLAMNDLASALPETWAVVVDRFAKASPNGAGNEVFRAYLEQGTAAVVAGRSFTRMERLGREIELAYLRQTRYATFGYEPLVAFFLLQENELRNLQLLYAAKLSGAAEETAQDLVAYVE